MNTLKYFQSFLLVPIFMLLLSSCNNENNSVTGGLNTDGSLVPCTIPVSIFTQYQETPVGWDPAIDVGAFVDVKNPSGTLIYSGIVPESGYNYLNLSCNSQTGAYRVIGKQVLNNQIMHYGERSFYYTGFETEIFLRLITYPY